MWKLLVAFIVFAAVALFVLKKTGGNVDMGGEKHDVTGRRRRGVRGCRGLGRLELSHRAHGLTGVNPGRGGGGLQ